jgi:hypothetical protein
VKYSVELARDVCVGGNVVPDEVEPLVSSQVRDVLRPAGNEVVQSDNRVAFAKKPIAQMRTEKTGRAGNQYLHWLQRPRESYERPGDPSLFAAMTD